MVSFRVKTNQLATSTHCWRGVRSDDGTIVVRDITGQDGALSLLDYALNLSPALRDTITRDVAQTVSKYEPRLQHDGAAESKSEVQGTFQSKAAFLLGAPKAPM